MRNFAVFILTHGRPDKLHTLNSLKRHGYSGKIYIIIDNEDETAEKYKKLYGKKVIQFDKLAISKTFDEADNFTDRRSIVYARNVSFEIARKLNIKYFIQLDDDYQHFAYRFNSRNEYFYKGIQDLNKIFKILLDFYKSIPAKSIAIAQGGDFIGGEQSGLSRNQEIKRKCMNSFICSTDRQFTFLGRINEDVTAYTLLGSRGDLFFTIPYLSLSQETTQATEGGMSGIYLDHGTYIKSFYTVMQAPSCTKIRLMGNKDMRLHHSIIWNNAVPKILNEKWRK